MLFRVDPANNQPLGEQIAACVRRGIASGVLGGGQRLPAARELAESLEVNMHTVLGAYRQLRDDGLIELRRGRGATVRTDALVDRAELLELAEKLVLAARKSGVDVDELVGIIRATHESGGV